jgi:hypothetical protein
MKVLNHLRAYVKVTDYCDTYSAVTLTRVKSLVMCLESILSPYPNDSQ